jgi:hypothetical protein
MKFLLTLIVFFADRILINVNIVILMMNFKSILIHFFSHLNMVILRMMYHFLIYTLMKKNMKNIKQFTLKQLEVDQNH